MEVKKGRAGVAVKNHRVITSEYDDATEDSATSPAPDGDKENFIRVFNAVDENVKFNIDVAANLIQAHDFKGLEGYILDVLTKVQGMCLCHHPGIFCSIYEAQISYLIKEKLFLEAENIFNDKVKPLLSTNIDELYKPSDLDSRVKMIQNCVNRKQLIVDGHPDVLGLLLDYFRLYFPSCLMDYTGRKGSVKDFVVSLIDDENGVRLTRCLACHCVVASSIMDQGELIKHYRGDIHVKSCFSVTKWMLAYLDYLQPKAGTEIQKNPVVKSSQKKRKSPSPLCGQGVQITVVDALMSKCDSVVKAITTATSGIAADRELAMTAVNKGKDILGRQRKILCDLMCLLFRFFDEKVALDVSAAFQKVRALSDLSDELVRVWRHLPSSSGMLKDVYVKVADLKTSLVLAEVPDRKTGFVPGLTGASGDVFSGSTSVGSCSRS